MSNFNRTNVVRFFLIVVSLYTALCASCGTVKDANGVEYPVACQGMTGASMPECKGFARENNGDLGTWANDIANAAQNADESK